VGTLKCDFSRIKCLSLASFIQKFNSDKKLSTGHSVPLGNYLYFGYSHPQCGYLKGPFHDTRGKAYRNKTRVLKKAPTTYFPGNERKYHCLKVALSQILTYKV
jgi:hypothetical protein